MEEMSPWASRRKSIYLVAIVLILSSISFAVFWKYWYRTPTCFDNVKNGDEIGVDCGGSCSLICSDEAIKPIVRWDPRLFEVSSGVWSALVYVENQNTNADAVYVPYTFTLYDENNNVLNERKGATILPKSKVVGIFEGSILIENGARPRRAVFEIGSGIVWKKNEEVGEKIKITHSSILKLETAPRVEANIKNNSIEEIKNIELVAAIFDGADNVIAASRTFIEKLEKDKSADVFFTWPKTFELGSKACEKPTDVMLLLDRSGSMASLGVNPPEPLSGAKEAAKSFAEQLSGNDKIGFISFASSVKDPIDLTLSSDKDLAKQIIGEVQIEASSTQYTNVFEPLHFAWQELISARAQSDSSKVIVLLTDGVANNPRDPQGRTEADDIKYAEELASKEAVSIKRDSIIIYTIGLGEKINEVFLKNLASESDNYFYAPTAINLETIYKNISSDICKEVPARIEITYKIFGDVI